MLYMITSLWYLWLLVLIVFLLRLYKPKIKGIIGEKTVSIILTKLDKDKYKVINDIIVKNGEKTSQIDHLVVSNYGVFVIETKNYKGWIYGDEYKKYWIQVIYKRKEKLYNPIHQNYGHVEALKNILINFEGIKFIPIVVFSINAELKINVKSEVVYTTKLLKTIKKYNKEIINNTDKEEIYNIILSSDINTKDIRKQHVNTIKKQKYDKQNILKSDICPKCGGNLVVKKGKYGIFKGCSNYPKCKYTVKVHVSNNDIG